MKQFIESREIQVYPSPNRGPLNDPQQTAFNPESHLLTENNNSNISFNIAHRSFVISDEYKAEKDFEFSILGHYFNLPSFTTLVLGLESGDEDVWVAIKLQAQLDRVVTDPDNTNYANWVLVTFDNENTPLDIQDTVSGEYEFKALKLFSQKPDETIVQESGSLVTKVAALHILHKGTDGWEVPEASRIKLDSRNISGGFDPQEGKIEKSLETYLHTNKISTEILTSEPLESGDETGNEISVTTKLVLNPEKSITTSTIIGNNISESTDLFIEGNTELNDNLHVLGSITGEVDLHIEGNSTISGTEIVTGTLKTEDELIADSKITGHDDLEVSHNISANSASITEGLSASHIDSDAIVNDETIENKGNILTKSLTIGVKEPLQTEVINLYSDGTSEFKGEAEFKDKISIKGAELSSPNGYDFQVNANAIYLNSDSGIALNAERVDAAGHIAAKSAEVSNVNSAKNSSVPNLNWVSNNTAASLRSGTSYAAQNLELLNGYGEVMSSVNLRQLIVDIVYPVGSIYITCDKYLSTAAAMNEQFGGTWEKLPEDLYLRNVSGIPAAEQDRILPSSLPNIKGSFADIEVHQQTEHKSIFNSDYINGVFSLKNDSSEHINYYINGLSAGSYDDNTQNSVRNRNTDAWQQFGAALVSAGVALPVAVTTGMAQAFNDVYTWIMGTPRSQSHRSGGSQISVMVEDPTALRGVYFNAHDSNSTYRDGAEVNVKSYTVFMYKRIR